MNLDAKLTRSQSAMVAGVHPRTIDHWRTRGLLVPAQARGHKLVYRLGDVLQAEKVTRQSPRSHRGPRVRCAPE